jgi:hypothetical protein
VQAQVKSDNSVPTEARLSPSSSRVHNIYTLLTANIHDDGTKSEFKDSLFHTLLIVQEMCWHQLEKSFFRYCSFLWVSNLVTHIEEE